MAGGKAPDSPGVPGGNPPMRPDQRIQTEHHTRSLPPGAQQGVIRANLIIVSGPVAGVFVYNGTPGPGNPPIVSITSGSSDPFGNPVVPGLDVTEGSITGTTITGGTITGTTFDGTDFVINSSGAFFYSSTPANGNLIASIARVGGTDAHGNAYLAGFTSYNPTAGNIESQLASGKVNLYTPTTGVAAGLSVQSSPGAQGMIVSSGELSGNTAATLELQDNGVLGGNGSPLATLVANLLINGNNGSGLILTVENSASTPSGPAVQVIAAAAGDNSLGIEVSGDTNNRLKIDSNGKAQWGSGSAGQDTNLYRGAANILQTDDSFALSSATGTPAGLAGAVLLYGATNGLGAGRAIGTLDVGGNAMVVGASRAVLLGSGGSGANATLATISIPANDITSGAVYRLSCWGNGNWGATPTNQTWAASLGATTLGSQTINSTAFAASASQRWKAEAMFTCTAQGAAGTRNGVISGIINETGSNLFPGVAATNSVPFAASAASSALDTTSANVFNIVVSWSGAFGSITATGGILERVG